MSNSKSMSCKYDCDEMTQCVNKSIWLSSSPSEWRSVGCPLHLPGRVRIPGRTDGGHHSLQTNSQHHEHEESLPNNRYDEIDWLIDWLISCYFKLYRQHLHVSLLMALYYEKLPNKSFNCLRNNHIIGSQWDGFYRVYI